MIRFSLRCGNGHRFDSWFKSSEAFEKLLTAGMVGCAVCGSGNVEKAPMAPRVNAGRRDDDDTGTTDARTPAGEKPHRPLSMPATPAEAAVAELRRRIETHAHDVGRDFARQARAMHDGEAPARPIHGEAAPAEARALIEDGVPVLPLPFRRRDKSN